MAKSLTPLSLIASEMGADLGDSNGRLVFSLLRKLIQGYREFHLYIDQTFAVKTITLKCDNVVKMPNDFIYETKVGILHNGHLAVMTLDKSLRKETLAQLTQNNVTDIWDGGNYGAEYTFYNYWNNGSLGELYGWGGICNTNGYYNIDRGKGEIYIGSLCPIDAEITIEYKSSELSEGYELVPTEAVTMLKYYALAEYYFNKNQGMYQQSRERYNIEKFKVKSLYNFRTALFMGAEAQSHFRSAPH